MLCITLKSFDRACAPTTGGISRMWIFDRDDFDFTQAADDADGSAGKYSALARRSGATEGGGGNLFPVTFQYKEAEYKYTQSLNGSSSKYDHSIEFLLPDIGHFITTWNEKVDAAAACCGIGVILELNSGKILVLGEKYVGGAQIRRWIIAQDGSTGTSGKLFEDVNGQTTILKGDYLRGAYEFSGLASALEALEGAAS